MYLPLSVAQDYATWSLPEGAKARLGKGTIEDIQFSPDNKLLAVASATGVWIYDVDTDEELALLTGHTGIVKSIAFSPNGSLLASASWDNTIRLWNVFNFSLNKTLTGHTSAVTSVTFSADSWTVASGSADNTIRLWDVITGRTENTFEGHTDRVTSVAFGPDDALLASGSWDKTVRLWNIFRGEHQQTFTGHTNRVTSVSFSQNPIIPILASGSHDRTIRLWDVASGELKRTLTEARMGPVENVCFRSDGYMLISGSVEGLVRIWATLNGALKQEIPVGFGDPNVCFSPDGSLFASADSERNIRLWYMTPKRNYEVKIIPTDTFGDPRLVLSQDGKTAAGFIPGFLKDPITLAPRIAFAWKIRTWDVSTGQLKAILTAEDLVTVDDIRFSPDGQTLASVGLVKYQDPVYVTLGAIVTDQVLRIKSNNSLTIRLWDVSTGRLKQSFRLHGPLKQPFFLNDPDDRYGYWSGVFSPDGLTLASSRNSENPGGVMDLFNVSTGELKQSFSIPEDAWTGPWGTTTAFSPDSETLIRGYSDGTIYLWNVATGNLKRTLIGHTEGIASVAFSPDGKTMASGSGRPESTVCLWDAVTGEHLHTIATGNVNFLYHILFSRDGKAVIADDYLGWLASFTEFSWYRLANPRHWSGSLVPRLEYPDRLWDSSTGEEIQSENGLVALSGHFVPDGEGLTLLTVRLSEITLDDQLFHGSTLVSLDLSGVRSKGVWERERDYKQQTITGHTGPVYSVSFGLNGNTLAVGSNDAVRLWNVAPPEIKDILPFNATTVAFNPDGWRLANGSWDGTIRLWHVPNNGQTGRLTGHTDHVLSVAFRPDNQILASGSTDKTVRLWDVEKNTLQHTLTGHTDEVTSVAFSRFHHDFYTLASASADKTIRLWNGVTGAHQHTLAGHTDRVSSVAFSPEDGILTLASGSYDGTIRLWDGITGAHKRTLTGHIGPVISIAFNSDGETLASGGGDITIRLWDPNFGTLKRILTGHTSGVTSVAFSPDDQTLASGSYDGTVLLWDLTPKTPKPADIIADINGDNIVNIQDLVLVSSNLGETGENPADVNDDGVVNIQDLVLVAAEFNKNAGAPSISHSDLAFAPTRAEVEQWLTQAQALNLTDATSLRGIRFLEQLLLALTPQETALLANYPNPFNPETWIPYQLAAPAEVTLRIHAIDGSLVRVLSLGHKPIGTYQSRSRAAYWDGKNALGEPVASGIYFYTLTAGDDFTATRKMIVRK